ncbi:hypothetical protein [Micromonospora sp. WMMC415]|uniref:hypothetical protein n=1 Tax=Micromonospora sp. WMMC415 TaxID=2675222 RepID=UPI0018AFA362
MVLTSGSFDPLRPHHIGYLQECRSFGCHLVVGVDSDSKVRHRKGPGRPRTIESQRANAVAALASVDLVVIKPAVWPRWQLIRWLKPDTLVVSMEHYTSAELDTLRTLCRQLMAWEPHQRIILEW